MASVAFHIVGLLSVHLNLAAHASPVAGVIGMLSDMHVKISSDGAAEDRAFHAFFRWCDQTTGEALHSIQLSKERVAKLKADIEQYFAEIESYGQTISEEAKSIAGTIQAAKKAQNMREKQHGEFKSSEKEMEETVDTLTRAITVLEEHMQKGSSFSQVINARMPALVQVVGAITDAAAFSTSDRSKLLQMLQEHETSDDVSVAAPAAAAYTSKGGGIIDMLESMKDKAETQLAELRQKETQARSVFKRLQHSLKMQQQADENELAHAKKDNAEAKGSKAEQEKDKTQTTKVLEVESEEYSVTKAQCMQTASDHEVTLKARNAELKVIDEAIKILKSTVGNEAQEDTFFQQSSAQHVSLRTSSDLAGLEAVTLVNRMAKMHHSTALARLGAHMNSVVYSGLDSADIFAKIKGMIQNLINKLEREAEDAATEKAYCDDQLQKVEAKKADLDDQIQSIGAGIDFDKAESAEMKDQVKELQRQLASLEAEQNELDKIRKDEHESFLKSKKDLDQGISGVRQALGVLRDFYANEETSTSSETPDAEVTPSLLQTMRQPTPPEMNNQKSTSAASAIIQLLEDIEGDFASSLAKIEAEEADAQYDYAKVTSGMEVDRASKKQELRFKTKEFKSLDKRITFFSSDLDAVTTEQSAVLEFQARLKDRCVAEPSTYEQRKKKREAEMMGLTEAQEILRNEAAYIQRKRSGNRLRGTLASA